MATASPARRVAVKIPTVSAAAAAKTAKDCGCSCSTNPHGCCQAGFGKKLILTLVGLALVYFIFFLGTLINNNIKKNAYIGRADKTERMITVTGTGKVTGQNNIAVTTIGYSNTDKDVAKAQEDNNAVMNGLMQDLKNNGIADDDLQTNYTVYPEYNYTSEHGQELIGYKVSNRVTIKIRDLNRIKNILALAGKYGATEVGGLTFTIDDSSSLKDEARVKALADVKNKAVALSQSLGVKFVEVVSYSEYEANSDFYYPKYFSAEGGGIGGGAPETVSGGSQDVILSVSVTYSLTE